MVPPDGPTTAVTAGQPAMAEPRVAVVILNWCRPVETMACLRSVMRLDHGNIDVVVCDNASGDGSLERILSDAAEALPGINAERQARGFAPFALQQTPSYENAASGQRLTIVPTGRNGGYAFGNNVGIRIALQDPRIEHVWILNNDTQVDPASLSHLVALMAQRPDVGICGAKVLYASENSRVQTLGGGHFMPWRGRSIQIGEGLAADAPVDAANVEAQLSYVNGAAAFVRRAVIDKVGCMNEGYFLYWEEIDWAMRMRAQGQYRLGFCPDARVYHQVGSSTGSSDHDIPSLGSTYWMTRSKFRFLRLHRPLTLLTVYPLLFRTVLKEMRAGRGPRGRIMLRAAFGLSMPSN